MTDHSGPTVWCVAGPPGSGKSTLGRELARAVHGALLDQDTATNPLMARIAELVGAGEDLDHPGLGGAVRSARYRCLIDVAAENSLLGTDVVMVAPFTQEVADAAAWQTMVELLAPATVVLVWVAVAPEVAAARRRTRGLPRDVAADLAAARGPAAAVPAVRHLLADGAADPSAEAPRILAAGGGWRPGPGRIAGPTPR